MESLLEGAPVELETTEFRGRFVGGVGGGGVFER